MNERIKELYEQSLIRETGKDHAGNPMLVIKQNPEKFAELIVRECMDCSSWVGKMNTNSVEPVHTAYAINQRIKKHFGVEE